MYGAVCNKITFISCSWILKCSVTIAQTDGKRVVESVKCHTNVTQQQQTSVKLLKVTKSKSKNII